MNIIKAVVRAILVLSCGGALVLVPKIEAAPGDTIPGILQDGFAAWAKGGVDAAFYVWQKGGLMEGGGKTATLAGYLKRAVQAAGSYKTYDLLQAKPIGRTSQVIYLALNCERGVVYGRFLMYRTDKDWVVQNMDFSPRPEALMPWLAFEGEKENE